MAADSDIKLVAEMFGPYEVCGLELFLKKIYIIILEEGEFGVRIFSRLLVYKWSRNFHEY